MRVWLLEPICAIPEPPQKGRYGGTGVPSAEQSEPMTQKLSFVEVPPAGAAPGTGSDCPSTPTDGLKRSWPAENGAPTVASRFAWAGEEAFAAAAVTPPAVGAA